MFEMRNKFHRHNFESFNKKEYFIKLICSFYTDSFYQMSDRTNVLVRFENQMLIIIIIIHIIQISYS